MYITRTKNTLYNCQRAATSLKWAVINKTTTCILQWHYKFTNLAYLSHIQAILLHLASMSHWPVQSDSRVHS